jgi:hypothetical protein
MSLVTELDGAEAWAALWEAHGSLAIRDRGCVAAVVVKQRMLKRAHSYSSTELYNGSAMLVRNLTNPHGSSAVAPATTQPTRTLPRRCAVMLCSCVTLLPGGKNLRPQLTQHQNSLCAVCVFVCVQGSDKERFGSTGHAAVHHHRRRHCYTQTHA